MKGVLSIELDLNQPTVNSNIISFPVAASKASIPAETRATNSASKARSA